MHRRAQACFCFVGSIPNRLYLLGGHPRGGEYIDRFSRLSLSFQSAVIVVVAEKKDRPLLGEAREHVQVSSREEKRERGRKGSSLPNNVQKSEGIIDTLK